MTRLLNNTGLSVLWYVLEHVPGDLSGLVVIQNTHGLRVAVPMSTKYADDLPDLVLMGRIRLAIADNIRP